MGTAAALIGQLALAFPGRIIHVVADAACLGPALRDLRDLRDPGLPPPPQRGAVRAAA